MIISVLIVPEDGEIPSVGFFDVNVIGTYPKFKQSVKKAMMSKDKMASLVDYDPFELDELPEVQCPCMVEDHVTIFLE